MIGGNVYDSNNPTHPYLNFVGYIDPAKNRQGCCSSVLISESVILTASHCIEKFNKGSLVRFYGESSGVIESIVPLDNIDVAICYLKNPITEINPICPVFEEPERGENVIVAGFGYEDMNTSSHRKTRLKWGFSKIHQNLNEQRFRLRWDSMICNVGDSGGPVIVLRAGQMRLLGIITGSKNDGVNFQSLHKSLPLTNPVLPMDHILFNQLLKVDIERVKIRKTLDDPNSDVTERSIDEWLLAKIKSE